MKGALEIRPNKPVWAPQILAGMKDPGVEALEESKRVLVREIVALFLEEFCCSVIKRSAHELRMTYLTANDFGTDRFGKCTQVKGFYINERIDVYNS